MTSSSVPTPSATSATCNAVVQLDTAHGVRCTDSVTELALECGHLWSLRDPA
jgi:hypothetical protein